MFESASLGRSYPAKEYAALENDLRMKLFKAQGTCIEHKLPVLITIAGRRNYQCQRFCQPAET